MFITYITLQKDKLTAKLINAAECQSIFSSDLKYFEIFSDEEVAKARLGKFVEIIFLKTPDSALDTFYKCTAPGFICTKGENSSKLTIKVKSGIYYFNEPIKLTNLEHLTIKADGDVYFRGTAKLGAWQCETNGIYSTPAPAGSDALYLGNKKYRMARFPKFNLASPIFNGFSRLATSPEKVSEWANPEGAYLHAMHLHNWGGFSYAVKGKTEANELILEGGWQNNRQMGMHKDFKFIENIKEELSEPGEWYFSTKEERAYVIPECSLSLNNEQAEVAINHAFFDIKNCSNIQIKGIQFERSARTFMLTKEPLLRSDWTIFRGGAIYFNNSENCSITNCNFFDVGSNAIFVDGKNSEISVSKCHFNNIGASAVCFVGRSDSVRSPLFDATKSQKFSDIDLTPGPCSDNYPRHCHVEDCLIEKVGQIEKQATGVELSMSYACSIINTSIYNTSRAAINISEGTFGGHLIDGCDCFDTVKETGDHGSFNSWGRDRYWHIEGLPDEECGKYVHLDCLGKTIIRNSRFRCDRGWDIDLDDGSSNYEIYNNLCLNGGIKLREGFNRHVHHNITINNSIHFHVWYKNSGDIVENNIVFTEYQPILMENGFGNRVDYNILNKRKCWRPQPAKVLAEQTGLDAHSILLDCQIQPGTYRVGNKQLTDFKNFPTRFGVRYRPLRKLAKQPVLPELLGSTHKVEGNITKHLAMKLKNIETDGEMSALATAGHSGVIVVDVEQFGIGTSKGLLPLDVIVQVGEEEITCVDDFLKINKEQFANTPITILRRLQGRITLA